MTEHAEKLMVFYPCWFFAPGDLLEGCRRIAQAGFDGVSFAAAPLDDPRRLDRLSETEAADLRSGLSAMDLRRSLHVLTARYLEAAPSPRAAVDKIKVHVERCVNALYREDETSLGLLNVTIDPPAIGPELHRTLLPELADELVGFLAALAGRYAICPGLENWPEPEMGTPEVLERRLRAGKGMVGILLDAGHAHITISRGWCAEQNMAEFVAALPAPVIEVHLCDNHGEEDEHLPPGEGTVDFRGMLDVLLAGGFDGPATVEADLEAEGRLGLAAGLEQVRAACGLA